MHKITFILRLCNYELLKEDLVHLSKTNDFFLPRCSPEHVDWHKSTVVQVREVKKNRNSSGSKFAYRKISAVPRYSKTVILSEETHVQGFRTAQR